MLASLKNPALMVVDMQNDFVRRHAPMEVASARETIPSISRLIAAFRGNGKPVVFTRYVADPISGLGRQADLDQADRCADPCVRAGLHAILRRCRGPAGCRGGDRRACATG
ncbi:isochorismatase family protein [Mesorhizobium sp. B2-6-3]|nr:isochorismatase family protein [Mesorhizobium sp. B3-1-1]TPJ64892.1 isochorismatase family protein [Mesorhizobium sp. B2-6-7]TPJ80793.1 isochorismatase family protein [Mesorhizobium sp. B2-6-3]TPK02080.1 isochorismatase family protein [Mesorhizobium sp. B2-5-10]TPK05337.1 isochorismatase family protein [Mesorhizobium sp. B2-5-11]TPK28594.1 isochorismatase family protein [Mesorhizobium sp. B2-5-8]